MPSLRLCSCHSCRCTCDFRGPHATLWLRCASALTDGLPSTVFRSADTTICLYHYHSFSWLPGLSRLLPRALDQPRPTPPYPVSLQVSPPSEIHPLAMVCISAASRGPGISSIVSLLYLDIRVAPRNHVIIPGRIKSNHKR